MHSTLHRHKKNIFYIYSTLRTSYVHYKEERKEVKKENQYFYVLLVSWLSVECRYLRRLYQRYDEFIVFTLCKKIAKNTLNYEWTICHLSVSALWVVCLCSSRIKFSDNRHFSFTSKGKDKWFYQWIWSNWTGTGKTDPKSEPNYKQTFFYINLNFYLRFQGPEK